MIRSLLAAHAVLTSNRPSVVLIAAGLLASFCVGSSASAQPTPIHRDDVMVNTETGVLYVNPRVLLVPEDFPGGSVGARRPGLSRGGGIGSSVWNTSNGTSGLRLRQFSKLFGLHLLEDLLVVTPQWESQVVDLTARPLIGLNGLGLVAAIEYAGEDGSDVGLIDRETGTEIQLDDPPNVNVGFQSSPRLSKFAQVTTDAFILAFESTHDPSTGAPGASIVVAPFGALGVPDQSGPARKIDEVSASNVFGPSITDTFFFFLQGAVNHFVVAWESFGSGGNDNSLSSIQARFVEPDGTPAGSQFQVNTAINGFQRHPDVAQLDDGNLVFVWESDVSLGDDDSLTSIQARLYGSDGLPLGPEFQVNNEITGHQFQPSVAAQDNGGFIVVWKDQPISETNLAGRQFGAGGVPLANQFQVNTLPGVSTDDPPHVAAVGDEFLAVWSRGGDIYMNGSFLILFADGFESSDLSAWSASVP